MLGAAIRAESVLIGERGATAYGVRSESTAMPAGASFPFS